jgi:hypothetical protein
VNTTPAEVKAVCEISTQLAEDPCAYEHHMLPAHDDHGGVDRWFARCANCPHENHFPGAYFRALRQQQEDML